VEEISGVGGEGVERIREVSWRRSIVRGEGSSGIVRRVASMCAFVRLKVIYVGS